MTYRSPDSERARARDAEAELARLADEGRRRKSAREEAIVRAATAKSELRAAPSAAMFRERVEPSSTRSDMIVFAGVALACVAATFHWAQSTGQVLWGLLMCVTVVGPLTAGAILAVVVHPTRRRYYARRSLAWHAALPFAFPSFVTVLARKGALGRAWLQVVLAPGAPPVGEHVISGLLGFTSHAKARARESDGTIVIEDGPGDPDAGAWVREIVEKVLLPIHATHPIASVELCAEYALPLDDGDGPASRS